MRIAFIIDWKDDKPRRQTSGPIPKVIYVFHLSYTTTKQLKHAGRQLRSTYYKEFVAMR